MPLLDDPPALRRLAALERVQPARPVPARAGIQTRHRKRQVAPPPKMGYQPGLDGLRALSVIAVILYHAGFGWMSGGFFGVEVFFVVSGFLITSLLLEEREGSGRVSMSGFWFRRAKRLLPALFAVLLAVAAWTAAFGSAEQVSQVRRDMPWSIFYVANWGQIFGDIPYFAEGDPPLLRHLWSLAVEEQWYLIWPIAFVLIMAARRSAHRTAAWLAGGALGVMLCTAVMALGGAPLLGGPGPLDGVDRVNFMYLSTFTRSSGLLLGAAAAFVWRPWRTTTAGSPRTKPTIDGRRLDISAGVAVGLLVCFCIAAHVTSRWVYTWQLPMVSILSLVAVLVVVHPAASGARRMLSLAPLVEIGRRSYGLYLWHWPIFVIVGVVGASTGRFVFAMLLTLLISEACYRYIETPIRRGALSRWWADTRRRDLRPIWALAAVIGLLVLYYVNVEPYDAAAGGDDVTFVAPADSELAGSALPVPAEPPAAAPAEPLDVAIVGDSQAHSLAINLPDGIDDTFTITDESLEGCSVYDSGTIVSSLESFSNDFGTCAGWQDAWASAGGDADVVLVVLGAWDVFDTKVDGELYSFGTPAADTMFTSNLQSGIAAATADGAHVALLEVACMRPQSVDGAGVPPLPERGDDARVAHLNSLMRAVAATNPSVTFVEGPDAWCADDTVSADLDYRWDGVHVYEPGANLIYETIAPTLLALPVR